MSAQQTAMNTQAAALEAACTALSVAYLAYNVAVSTATAAAAAGDRNPLAVVSGDRLNQLIASRMRALSLGPVLDAKRATFVVPATWATDLVARVTALVP